MSAGGLSSYERYEILFERLLAREPPWPPENSVEFSEEGAARAESDISAILDEWRTEPFSDSPEPFEVSDLQTYRYLTSYLFRRPIDFYRDINIPVLFLHGELDSSVIVESTRYVEENLPGKPFAYIYYPEMGHAPRNYGDFMAFRRDISAWLKVEGL